MNFIFKKLLSNILIKASSNECPLKCANKSSTKKCVPCLQIIKSKKKKQEFLKQENKVRDAHIVDVQHFLASKCWRNLNLVDM